MSLLEIVIFAEVLKDYFRRNKVINNGEKKRDKISLYCVCNGQFWEVEIKKFSQIWFFVCDVTVIFYRGCIKLFISVFYKNLVVIENQSSCIA